MSPEAAADPRRQGAPPPPHPMKKSQKRLWKHGVLVLIVGIYPLFLLLYVWGHILRSDLEGGRNGPLDAYRHSLASSVVAYTLDERVVDLVTRLMETGNKNSNKMDIHNNRIGAQIGAKAQSFRELEPAVRRAVSHGAINSADEHQITWLPEKSWRDSRFW